MCQFEYIAVLKSAKKLKLPNKCGEVKAQYLQCAEVAENRNTEVKYFKLVQHLSKCSDQRHLVYNEDTVTCTVQLHIHINLCID